MTTSKASGEPSQTVTTTTQGAAPVATAELPKGATPEHDTHEQPTAANYTAGDSFAKIAAEMGMSSQATPVYRTQMMQWKARIEALCAAQQEQRDSLAASHREPSGRGEAVAFAVYGKSDEYGEVLLSEYVGSMEVIRRRVMLHAGREGFVGSFDERMAELGWWIEPLCRNVQPADKPAREAVTDAQIEAALDMKVGLDHTLRGLIRGDTVAVGWSKVDVVRKLLEALAPEPATAVAPLYTHPAAATVRDASVDPALTLDVARELLSDCARAIEATPADPLPASEVSP